MNKKLLIPTLILGATVLTGAISYASLTKAQLDTDVSQKLAEKLNLSQDQVLSAFDSIREEKQAERQAQVSENLDKAVADSVITTEQKQEILTKQEEFQNKQQALMQERQDWLENNGIDEDKLADYEVGLGFGRHHGHGGPSGGMGMMMGR